MSSEFDKRKQEGASLRRSMMPSPQQTSSTDSEGAKGGGTFSSHKPGRKNPDTETTDADVTATLHGLFQRELKRLDDLSRARALDRHEVRVLGDLVKAYSNFRRQSLPDNDESLSDLSDDELKALLEDPPSIK